MTIIAGAGEVGKALGEVLSTYKPIFVDPRITISSTVYNTGQVDVLHIAFPYTKDFVAEVKRYQQKYKPTHTIIHSTVPVGTSRPQYTRQYDINSIIEQYRIAGWRGIVNIPSADIREYGGIKTE